MCLGRYSTEKSLNRSNSRGSRGCDWRWLDKQERSTGKERTGAIMRTRMITAEVSDHILAALCLLSHSSIAPARWLTCSIDAANAQTSYPLTSSRLSGFQLSRSLHPLGPLPGKHVRPCRRERSPPCLDSAVPTSNLDLIACDLRPSATL